MKMGIVLGHFQEQRLEVLILCGACDRPLDNSSATLYVQGIRQSRPHKEFLGACKMFGHCPICCQKIGSDVPSWVLSRAQAIWDGAREESKERFPMGTPTGVLTSWDFK